MSTSHEFLVLQASNEELRLVLARLAGDTVELCQPRMFLSGKQGEDGSALRDETTLDAMAEAVDDSHWIGKDLICLIGGSSVACQYYDMPPLKGDALRQALLLKLDQQLHFKTADAIVDIEELAGPDGEKSKQNRVCATAVHQDAARAAVDAAARIGLNVVAITAVPAAITALAREKIKGEAGLHAVLQVDERAGTLVVLNEGEPCVVAELPIGIGDLTKALMRPIIAGDDIIQLDEDQAAGLRNEVGIPAPNQKIEAFNITGAQVLPLLEPTLQQFCKYLVQWLTFATTSVGAESVQSIRLVGPGASIHGFAKTLASRLKLDIRSEHWLEGAAVVTGTPEGMSSDVFSAVVAGTRYWRTLPDLIPPEVHRRRLIRRIRRSVAFCGMFVAAAIVAFAVLFQQVGAAVFPSVAVQQQQLAEVQRTIVVNAEWQASQEVVASLRKQFDDFTRQTPAWSGVFKEVSVLLPREVQATGFDVGPNADGMRLTLSGVVYADEHGRSFDQSVAQTLLLLQRSSFFKNVQLRGANHGAPSAFPDAAGSLRVDLDLVYPHVRT